MRTVSQQIECVFVEDDGTTWDAFVDVDLEYTGDDPSVGYYGGWSVVGHEVVRYESYSEDGEPQMAYSKATMDGMVVKPLIDKAVDKWVAENEEILHEEADREERDDREAAEEAHWDAVRESRYDY